MDDERRRDFARQVMKKLAVAKHRERFVRNERGEFAVLVALPTDTLEDVYSGLPDGQSVNLVVPTKNWRGAQIVVCRPAAKGSSRDADECNLHPESEVGMLLALLSAREGEPIRCKVVRPDYEMELIRT